jgi:hypothetical protein
MHYLRILQVSYEAYVQKGADGAVQALDFLH